MVMEHNNQAPEVSKAESETNSAEEEDVANLMKLQLSGSTKLSAASELLDQMVSAEEEAVANLMKLQLSGSTKLSAASEQLDKKVSSEKIKVTANTPLKASQASNSNVVDPSSDKYIQPNQPESPFFERLLRILGVKDDISAVADAFMKFDKQALTSIHNKASIYLTHPEIGKVLLMHETPKKEYEGTHEATEVADELVPISLKDLKPGKRNDCAVLYGELCVNPFKLGRIYTMLEEMGTGKAVALSIVSEDASSIDQSFASDNYPQGKKIAVKEPMLVRGEGGFLFININNPLSIEPVEGFPVSADVNVTVPKFNKLIDAINEAYESRDWDKCMRNCTKGLLCSSKGMRINDFTIIKMYATRWRAQIEVGRYAEALPDAETFCKLRPSFSGGIMMKIRSLLSLGGYQDLYHLLHSARANNAFGDEDLRAFTSICRTWGARYFDVHITGAAAPRPSFFKPDGDLIGPVEIRKTKTGNGRGLFATEDIKAGDCLLISKALAISHKAMDDPVNSGLFGNVKNALNSSGDNILKLFLSHASCQLVPKMGDFFNASPEEKCVTVTARVREDYEALPDKDRKIRRIIEGIAFDDSSPAAIREKGKPAVIFNPVPTRLYYGVWLLPSFINHSCTPNAARINEGEVLKVHATRSIKVGQEITIPYFNVLLPYSFRQKLCHSFRFGSGCKCKRCELERKIIRAESKAETLYESYSSACNAKIEERPALLQKLVNRVEKCLTVLRKRKLVGDKDGEAWIRSSFMAAYLGCISCRKDKMASSGTDEEVLLREAHSIIETCPGDIQCLIFCQSCLSLWKDLAAKGLADEKYARQAYDMMAKVAISVYGMQIDTINRYF